jgi:7-carboxy-7-deazaguanine synthase
MPRIAEIFYSLQGEGMYLGAPSVFVRFSGCNLRCSWCDTPYASWNPQGEMWDFERVWAEISKYPRAKHVVFTGGEPCMFPELGPWIRECKKRGKSVTVETAGTFDVVMEADLLSISPKLSNSTPDAVQFPDEAARHEKLRLQLDVLQNLIDRAPLCQLKFVVESEADVPEIEALLSKLSGIDRDQVYLMPQAAQRNEHEDLLPKLIRICLYKGFRLAPRLHVQLWDGKAGT